MSGVTRFLSLITVGASLCVLSACGSKAGCGNSFSASSTGSGTSGTGGGGTANCGSTGGGGNGTALDYLYSTINTSINGSYFNGTDLLPLVGFTSPDLGSGGAADMLVVNKKFLYQPWAPTSTTANVYGFAVDQTNGDLAPVAGSPFTMDAVADALATDPNGKFLFMGQSATFAITVMQIDATSGALTAAPGSPFSLNGLIAQQMTVDASGKYLYTTIGNIGSGVVLGFSIDQTSGALTPLLGSPYVLGLGRLVAIPGAEFLVGAGSGQLELVSIDATTGDLAAAATVTPASTPSEVLVHPNGKFVYTFNQSLAPIEGFSFDPIAGTLTELTGSPFTNAQLINSAKIDSNGTAIVGLTSTTTFGLVTVDPTSGVVTSPGNPSLGPGSDFFAVIN